MMAENKNKQQPFYRRTWVLGRRRRPIVPSGPTTLILDQFTDTNGTALASHTIAPINTPAATWSVSGFTIQSNHASYSGAGNTVCIANAGVSDGIVSAEVNRAGNGSTGLFVRWSSGGGSGNGWHIGFGGAALNIFQVDNGSFTLRATVVGTFTAGVDYLMVATLNGTSITATVGATSVSYTSAVYQTNTNHGIRAADAGDTFDDFTVTTL